MSDDDKPAWLVVRPACAACGKPRRASTGTPTSTSSGLALAVGRTSRPLRAMATARTLVVHLPRYCRWQWQRRCDLSRTSGGNRGGVHGTLALRRHPNSRPLRHAGFCKECDAAYCFEHWDSPVSGYGNCPRDTEKASIRCTDPSDRVLAQVWRAAVHAVAKSLDAGCATLPHTTVSQIIEALVGRKLVLVLPGQDRRSSMRSAQIASTQLQERLKEQPNYSPSTNSGSLKVPGGSVPRDMLPSGKVDLILLGYAVTFAWSSSRRDPPIRTFVVASRSCSTTAPTCGA